MARAIGFWPVLGLVLLVKIALALALPMTGDEAYFFLWSQTPALGYYDHPGATGLWLSVILGADHSVLAFRAMAIFASVLPAIAIHQTLSADDERARLAGIIALFAPLQLIGILMTTDTLLIVFGLLAVIALRRAMMTGRGLWVAAAGTLIGLAFLSKYFAALLAIALFVYVLIASPKRWRDGAILVAFGLPAIAINLWWNSENCWYNLTFNLVNRQDNPAATLREPLVYLATLLWLVTPWGAGALLLNASTIAREIRARRLGAWAAAGLIPLLLLGALALTRSVGVHWLALFVPGLLMLIGLLPRGVLARLVPWTVAFGALHLVALTLLLTLPLSLFSPALRTTLAFHRAPENTAVLIRDLPATTHLATTGYARAAMLAWYTDRPVSVFGTGSRFGRHDDVMTDYSAMDGADIVIAMETDDRAKYAPYFAAIRVEEIAIPDGRVVLLHGSGFDFARYRAEILTQIEAQFYQPPAWLPPAQCPFTARYAL